MINEASYKSMLGRWGVRGVVLCSLPGMGAWDPRAFQMKMWKLEIFMGSLETDIDSGARTPEFLNSKILYASSLAIP